MRESNDKTTPIAWLAAAASVAGALLEVGRMFRYLIRSLTNALWVDQWVMLEELWRFRDGRYSLAYLWTPYWGHRIPVPRLVFLLDERLFHFSNLPLVALNIVLQFLTLGVLAVAQWELLSEKSRPLALGVIAVTSYLLFSGLQMENFVYGMSIQFAIGYSAAIAAMACGVRMRRSYLALAVGFALVSTLAFAAGLVIWPLLALQAFLLRKSRRRIFTFFAIGTFLAILYSVGYSQPGSGMGMSGILRHPLQAIGIAAMFLGGPLSLLGIPWGQAAGIIGIALSLYLLSGCLRRTAMRPHFVALLTIALWLIAISFGIPLARMRPEWIASFHGAAPLPSRYFTLAFLFWSCLAATVLSRSGANFAKLACLLSVAAVAISTISRESAYLNDWLTFCQTLDAAATGFIVGADDPDYMARSYPDQKLLDHWIRYARQYHLSIFAEPRAELMGQRVPLSTETKHASICRLSLDTPAQAGNSTRLSGAVDGPFNSLGEQRDLLFSNSSGIVIGLGRTFVDAQHGTDKHRFVGYVSNKSDRVSNIYFLDHRGNSQQCFTDSSSDGRRGRP